MFVVQWLIGSFIGGQELDLHGFKVSKNPTTKVLGMKVFSHAGVGFYLLIWVKSSMISIPSAGAESKHRSCKSWLATFAVTLLALNLNGGLHRQLSQQELTLRVQVPNNHMPTRNLYYNYYYPKPKYLIIGYMDPLGQELISGS